MYLGKTHPYAQSHPPPTHTQIQLGKTHPFAHHWNAVGVTVFYRSLGSFYDKHYLWIDQWEKRRCNRVMFIHQNKKKKKKELSTDPAQQETYGN